MASKNTSSSPNGRQKVQRSNSDSARWVAGLLLLFIGVFAASAVLFSFFTWAADQSGLLLSPEERATLGVEPGNLCGWAGARDRKSTRLNSSHYQQSRMPSSA